MNSRDEDYLTPLHYAAQEGHLSIVEYLITQKVDLFAQTKDVELLNNI